MTVFNFGSINIDHFYKVQHLPAEGETISAISYSTGLGGKGANQSVAAARAGAETIHIGAVGPDGDWVLQRLRDAGVATDQVVQVAEPTAHAIINVDQGGENAIVIFVGAGAALRVDQVRAALGSAKEGDILLLQNETPLQPEAAQIAKAKGMYVVYSAAPFDAAAARAMLPFTDLLVLNEVEAAQLTSALDLEIADIPVPNLLITKGAKGCMWRLQEDGREIFVDAFAVDPVDTTAAGDCFLGYCAAGMDQGFSAIDAMRLGAAASAIKVTRLGTADAIPARAEVDAFLQERAE